MTITELQKKLQEMYKKHGNVEVVMEYTYWTGSGTYHNKIFIKDKAEYNRKPVVILAFH